MAPAVDARRVQLAAHTAHAREAMVRTLDLTGPAALRPFVIAGLVRSGRTVLPVTATTTLSATVAAVQVVPGHELPPPTPPRRLCRAPPIRTPLAPVASRPHFVVIVRVADAKLPVQPVVLRQQTRLGSARRLRPLLRLMPDCRARAPLPFGRVVRSPSLR